MSPYQICSQRLWNPFFLSASSDRLLLFCENNFFIDNPQSLLFQFIGFISFFICLQSKRVYPLLYFRILQNREGNAADMVIIYFIDNRTICVVCYQRITIFARKKNTYIASNIFACRKNTNNTLQRITC